MKNQFETKENLAITTEVLNTDDLVEIIYKGEHLPQDKRFLSTEEGGVFKYFSLKKDFGWYTEDKFYPVVKVGDKIVGLSKLQKDPQKSKKNLWIQFLSIDPEEEGKGYASKLARKIFEFAKENEYSLETSSYSSDKGFEKLRPLFERLAKEYGIEFINKGKL
jgi:GNAT superfamily N-acetyltransferase